MEILLSIKVWDPKPWIEGLNQLENVSKVHLWPTNDDLSKVEALFVWKPMDDAVVEKLPNLKWVSSLGAGADHLTKDAQIPSKVPISRIVDKKLTADMTNFVIMGVMMYQRKIELIRENQSQRKWDRLAYDDLKVGVLGLGNLGAHAAKHLSLLGFVTKGFSRTPKQIDGVSCFSGNQMSTFLNDIDVLVNLLPVIPETESILNEKLFGQLKKGTYLINAGRGNHLHEADLIAALDSGQLSGALLDVFRVEPLPKENLLWAHPKVTITPHVASVTSPASALVLLEENIARLKEGRQLLYQVDKELGY